MSIIHVRQIKRYLEKEFIPLIDMSDMGGNKNENMLLSRSTAAYALTLLSHISNEEAVLSITDGSKDNGIDAIYVDVNNARLYVVQSKWIESGKSEPDRASIKKFCGGVVDLINLKFDRFNEKIKSRQQIITNALEDPSFKMSIVLTYTSVDGPDNDNLNDLEDLISSLNDANEVVELNILKQSQLHRGLTINVYGEPINLDVTMTCWGKKADPHPAWYGQVSGNQISEWWSDNHDRLFSRNIRGLLNETDINLDIRNTLLESPDLFWYYNNGITLVAKEVKRPLAHASKHEIVTLNCLDISVVNGAQTVGSIGRFFENPLYETEDITVHVRIIDLGEDGSKFGTKITRSNNRQNRIENRDFVALDDEQQRIQNELSADGISYQLLRSGNFQSTETAFDIVEATIALVCSMGDGTLVVQLKREISRLWDDLTKVPYKKIFNPSISGFYVWRCVRTQRLIDDSINTLIKSSTAPPELRGVLVHGNRILAALIFDQLNSKRFADPDYDFESTLDSKRVLELIINSAKKLNEGIDQHYPKSPLPTLFKNSKKCKDLLHSCHSDTKIALQQLSFDFPTDENI